VFRLATLFNILPTVTGQLGPTYDPLFYDVILYIVAAVIAIIVGIIAIIVFLVSRKKVHVKPHMKTYKDPYDTAKSKATQRQDDTQFWVCPNCGSDTQMKDERQYCPSCRIYL